jgi:hypothetical protein
LKKIMKKLKLDLDQLQVVSFTMETKGSRGTVNGLDSADTDIGCGGTGGNTDGGIPAVFVSRGQMATRIPAGAN